MNAKPEGCVGHSVGLRPQVWPTHSAPVSGVETWTEEGYSCTLSHVFIYDAGAYRMTESRSTESEPASSSPSGMRTFLRNLWETAKVFIVSLAIIIPVRAYVAQPFFVRGASMAPTFSDGEYLVIDELSSRTRIRPWQRGDVIVFRYPLDHTQYYIKRIIGLPSERVRIAGGTITVFNAEFPNGVILDESTYLPTQERTEGVTDMTLREHEVFVLGDNRDHSSDSRTWGALPRDLVVGRAWIRAFPLARAEVLDTPWYGSLTSAMETMGTNR